jgi:hypothetical protein
MQWRWKIQVVSITATTRHLLPITSFVPKDAQTKVSFRDEIRQRSVHCTNPSIPDNCRRNKLAFLRPKVNLLLLLPCPLMVKSESSYTQIPPDYRLVPECLDEFGLHYSLRWYKCHFIHFHVHRYQTSLISGTFHCVKCYSRGLPLKRLAFKTCQTNCLRGSERSFNYNANGLYISAKRAFETNNPTSSREIVLLRRYSVSIWQGLKFLHCYHGWLM